MNKENYLKEVERRLTQRFMASKEGYKISSVERHRLEGFMHAGVFMKLVTNAELAEVMNNTHVSVFGMSIKQRETEQHDNWQEDVIDYSHYDQPTFER